MSYHVSEVVTKADLDVILDVIWAADGDNLDHQLFYPIFGDGPEARQAAIVDSKDDTWASHNGNPSSHWIYVREGDPNVGRIVGGSHWYLYEHNPFPDGSPRVTADMWPEGVGRLFASEVARQIMSPRFICMGRPHSGL